MPTPLLTIGKRAMSTATSSPLVGVVNFWFKELGPKQWYAGGKEVDDICTSKFRDLHEKLAADTPPEAWTDPLSALGAIILYDQMPRNMFRKTPRAFATDPQALALAKNAVAKGFNKSLSQDQVEFLYMPYMHSENLADQEESVRLFKTCNNEIADKHAEEHHDIVAKYGRFPHRNECLGRTNTPEETEFLAGHAGFGQ